LTLTTNNLARDWKSSSRSPQTRTSKRQNLKIKSEASEVIHACSWLKKLLGLQQVDPTLTFQLETVLCEVLNNIITHAYAHDDNNNSIDLHFRVIKRKIILTIDDYGKGMNEPIQKKKIDFQTECGRGWLIIQSWTDTCRYWSFRSINRHCLVKYF
jgi:anti-sigma regulatory factor (Ser/Thr protein kinase)